MTGAKKTLAEVKEDVTGRGIFGVGVGTSPEGLTGVRPWWGG